MTSTIKLVIKAGQAKPAPPVGPALGQAGLNIMNFCKDFNAKTADIKVWTLAFITSFAQVVACYLGATHACTALPQEETPIPVLITAYSDKTFQFVSPQASVLMHAHRPVLRKPVPYTPHMLIAASGACRSCVRHPPATS